MSINYFDREIIRRATVASRRSATWLHASRAAQTRTANRRPASAVDPAADPKQRDLIARAHEALSTPSASVIGSATEPVLPSQGTVVKSSRRFEAEPFEHQLAVRRRPDGRSSCRFRSLRQPSPSESVERRRAGGDPLVHQPLGVGLHQRLHAAGHRFICAAVAQLVMRRVGPRHAADQRLPVRLSSRCTSSTARWPSRSSAKRRPA